MLYDNNTTLLGVLQWVFAGIIIYVWVRFRRKPLFSGALNVAETKIPQINIMLYTLYIII